MMTDGTAKIEEPLELSDKAVELDARLSKLHATVGELDVQLKLSRQTIKLLIAAVLGMGATIGWDLAFFTPGRIDSKIKAENISKVVADAVEGEGIPDQISTVIEDEDIPGQISKAIEDEDIPGQISKAIEDEDIPGQISKAIEDEDIPGQISKAIEDEDIPGQISKAIRDETDGIKRKLKQTADAMAAIVKNIKQSGMFLKPITRNVRRVYQAKEGGAFVTAAIRITNPTVANGSYMIQGKLCDDQGRPVETVTATWVTVQSNRPLTASLAMFVPSGRKWTITTSLKEGAEMIDVTPAHKDWPAGDAGLAFVVDEMALKTFAEEKE